MNTGRAQASRRPGFYVLFAIVFGCLMIAGGGVGAMAVEHHIGWLNRTMVYFVPVNMLLCIRMVVLAVRARARRKVPFDLVTIKPEKPRRQ